MKKNTFLISVVFSAVWFIINYNGTYFWCDIIIRDGHYGHCPFILADVLDIFLVVIPFSIFSLITYPMKEEIFQSWWKFSRIWMPLSMLSILISPSYANNWMFPIEKGNVAFFLSLAFVCISVFIIINQLFKIRKRK